MDDRKKQPYDAFGDHAPIEGKSTEGDYISREAAIRALEFRCKILTIRGGQTAADILTRYGIKTIRNRNSLPAADVRPVVRGKWIQKPFLLGTTNVCSRCESYYGMPHEVFNFCPNCGADMREV